MKKAGFLVLLFSIYSASIFAQSFTFVRTSPPIVYGTIDSLEIKSYGEVNNLTSDSIPLQIQLSNIVLPTAKWEAGFCTWKLCYAPGTYNTTEKCPSGVQTIYVYFFPDDSIPGTASARMTITYGSQSIYQDFTVSTNPNGIKKISSAVTEFSLNQNYPNPFNPTTKISFSLPERNLVSLKVFDLLGRQVANLIEEDMNAGQYEYEFDAKYLSSGMYYYSLRSGSYVAVKKMVLVK